MKILVFAGAQLFLIILMSEGLYAQSTKDKDKKPPTSTVDAWRRALPKSEQPSNVPPIVVDEEAVNKVNSEESAEHIERRILGLEQSFLESMRQRDSVTLEGLIANDFMLAGLNVSGNQPDKERFINWVLNELRIRSYNVENTLVRVHPATAIVMVNYKRQASLAGFASDGDFVVTNVWVKRGQTWQIMSHHVSQPSKPS